MTRNEALKKRATLALSMLRKHGEDADREKLVELLEQLAVNAYEKKWASTRAEDAKSEI
jgi:predicted transposase YdaD